jgi:hypothetical protein
LTEGRRYRLRFVALVRDVLDVRVLERVGDRQAQRQLRTGAESEALPPDVREEARKAEDRLRPRPFPAEALRHLSDEGGERHFTWEGQEAWLRVEAATPGLVLDVAVAGGEGPLGLARVRLLDAKEETLTEGYVGLTRDDRGVMKGRANFDVLAEGWPDENARLLSVSRWAVESLDWGDYEILERSRRAGHPSSRRPLDQALAWMRRAYREQLPASVYGVPAAEAVTAVLPGEEEALDRLLDETLRASLAELGTGVTNRRLMERAQEKLVGRARLSAADRLRLLESGARQVDRLFQDLARESRGQSRETPAGVASTTVDACLKAPEVVLARAARLAELDAGDEDKRLAARVYRLTELAGQDPGDIDAELLAELGMAREELEVRRSFGVLKVHATAS